MNEPGVKEVSLSDKGQEQVAARTDSEVHTATLGALRNREVGLLREDEVPV